jgi:hypothetical protein
MIKDIIDLLAMDNHYGISKQVDIAKGRYKIAYNWRDGKQLIKRIWNGR